jgi:hypothetical protein
MAESSGPSPTISGDSIKVIAETVGIANLKGEVAEALAADVEYRLRDLVQVSSCGCRTFVQLPLEAGFN